MAAKITSCFSFLKEALILPSRNPKLFTPIFLFLAFTVFIVPLVNVLSIQPLTDDMTSHLIKMQNTDPSSAEYARLLGEIKQDAEKLAVITTALIVVTLVLTFVKQILAFFAASTTYSGDRYSLAELLRELTRGNKLKGPSITIAVITLLNFAFMAILTAVLFTVMSRFKGMAAPALIIIFLPAFLGFLYFAVVALVSVAASVADEEYRGVSALRQAWRLMTRVRRKEGAALAVVILLLPMAVAPIYGVALAYLKKKSVAMGLGLLLVYALLSGAEQVFNFAAATVYYYQATESKEVVMPCDYVKIHSGEADV